MKKCVSEEIEMYCANCGKKHLSGIAYGDPDVAIREIPQEQWDTDYMTKLWVKDNVTNLCCDKCDKEFVGKFRTAILKMKKVFDQEHK